MVAVKAKAASVKPEVVPTEMSKSDKAPKLAKSDKPAKSDKVEKVEKVEKAEKTKVPVKTITLKQIAGDLAAMHDMPKSKTEALLSDMVEMVVKTIKKGSKVRLTGIGILQVKKRAARNGRNPATGEAIKIKASKKVSLSVAADLKAAL